MKSVASALEVIISKQKYEGITMTLEPFNLIVNVAASNEE